VKRFLYVLLLTVLLTSCTQVPATATEIRTPRPTFTPRPPNPTPSEAELEITDPTKPIEVKVGSTFTITVRTAPYPEYHWEVAEALDENIVAYVWKDHIPDDAAKVNSSGKDVWRFQGVGPGTTHIQLGYYKGMESTSQIEYVYKIVVTE
jgi:predicted secreted protein